MKYTIHYKDHLNRKNQSEFSGKDEIEAETKFKTLHPDCIITNTELKNE